MWLCYVQLCSTACRVSSFLSGDKSGMFILLLQFSGALGMMAFHLARFLCFRGVFNAIAHEINNKSFPSSKIATGSLAHAVNYSVISFISLAESLYPSCLNRSVEADLSKHTDTSWKLSTLRASQTSHLVFKFKWAWRAVEIHFCKCKSHQLRNPQMICSSLKHIHCGRPSTIQPHAQTCLSAVL